MDEILPKNESNHNRKRSAYKTTDLASAITYEQMKLRVESREELKTIKRAMTTPAAISERVISQGRMTNKRNLRIKTTNEQRRPTTERRNEAMTMKGVTVTKQAIRKKATSQERVSLRAVRALPPIFLSRSIKRPKGERRDGKEKEREKRERGGEEGERRTKVAIFCAVLSFVLASHFFSSL